MRGLVRGTLVALLGATLVSCSKDEPTAPAPAQLAGTWNATLAEYVSRQSAGRVDVLTGGGAVQLVLTADHRYAYVERRAGAPPDTTRGGWTTSADEMTWTFDAHPGWTRSFALALSGNTLRLTGGDVLYDFGAGGLEEADHNLVLTRP